MTADLKIRLWQFFCCTTILTLWEATSFFSPFWKFLIASPSSIFAEFIRLCLNDNLFSHFAITGAEAILGLIFGTVIGSSSGLLLWYSDTAARIARPFILAIGSLPIIAFAPLMIVWFGVGFEMKIALSCFSTVFVAFTQAYRGANLVESEYLDTLRGMHATKKQLFHKIIFPGSIDSVLSSMRLNIGFSILGAFIGEFIAADKGLGYLILRASGLYNMPRAFAAALGITFLALFLDFLGHIIERERYSLIQWFSLPKLLWKN